MSHSADKYTRRVALKAGLLGVNRPHAPGLLRLKAQAKEKGTGSAANDKSVILLLARRRAESARNLRPKPDARRVPRGRLACAKPRHPAFTPAR